MERRSFSTALFCLVVGIAVPGVMTAAYVIFACTANVPEWIGPGIFLAAWAGIAFGGSFLSAFLCRYQVSASNRLLCGALANSALWVSLAYFLFFACSGGNVISEYGLALLAIGVIVSVIGFLITWGVLRLFRSCGRGEET
jgi:hypothetical protein